MARDYIIKKNLVISKHQQPPQEQQTATEICWTVISSVVGLLCFVCEILKFRASISGNNMSIVLKTRLIKHFTE